MTTLTNEPVAVRSAEAAGADPVAAPGTVKARLTLSWWARSLVTIALVHVFVMVLTLFLMAVGEALYTSYIILLQNTVFVAYVTQASWLRDMAADLRGGVAVTVAASAFLQMLLLTWRAATT